MAICPTVFDSKILPWNIACLAQPVEKGGRMRRGVFCGPAAHKRNERRRLLRTRDQWPHHSSSEKFDERSALHSTSSSASASRCSGMLSPSAFTALILSTKSYFV